MPASALLAFTLFACEAEPTLTTAELDGRYVELARTLAIAERDTARDIRDAEARERKVQAEQARDAFFQDPAVIAAIESLRQSPDPELARKGALYWRHAVFVRSWTTEERERESALLARIEESRNREASWSSPDGATTIGLVGRWPNVSRDADALPEEQRADLLVSWAEVNNAWIGEDLDALVRLRNEVARREGFNSWWELALAHRGVDRADLDALLAELRALLTPINQANSARLQARATADGLAWSLANEPLLRRREGLMPERTQADNWFDTDPLERRAQEVFGALGAPLDGLQLYIGPSRYTRPGAYGFAIRPPTHAAVVISNDRRYSLWPYQALFHEVGRATWWRALSPAQAASAVLWEPDGPWFEGYGQIFERMLSEPSYLERYVPELPAELRPALAEYRRSSTVDTLTWYLGATQLERMLYEQPGQHMAWCQAAAALEKDLRGWSFELPTTGGGLPWSGLVQSGLMLNYPAYVQNFLYASVTEAILWESLVREVGDPVANPRTVPWLQERVITPVNAGRPFPEVLSELSQGRPRTAALAAELGAP